MIVHFANEILEGEGALDRLFTLQRELRENSAFYGQFALVMNEICRDFGKDIQLHIAYNQECDDLEFTATRNGLEFRLLVDPSGDGHRFRVHPQMVNDYPFETDDPIRFDPDGLVFEVDYKLLRKYQIEALPSPNGGTLKKTLSGLIKAGLKLE